MLPLFGFESSHGRDYERSSYVSMTISDIVLNHSTTTTPKCIEVSELLRKGRRYIASNETISSSPA
jgi:hypothetical protein